MGRSSGRLWLHGYSWVTSPTNERTSATSPLPRAAAGNSEPIIISARMDRYLLLAESFVCDYVAPSLGGVNFTFGCLKQLSVPPPEDFAVMLESSDPRLLELAYTAWDIAGFAANLRGITAHRFVGMRTGERYCEPSSMR